LKTIADNYLTIAQRVSLTANDPHPHAPRSFQTKGKKEQADNIKTRENGEVFIRVPSIRQTEETEPGGME
jgi:hypothetical protein